MRRLSIKWLLVTLCGASVIGAGLTLGLLYMQQDRMLGYLENISQIDGPLLFHLQDAYAQGLQTEQATRNVILNPNDREARSNFENADKQFRQALGAAKSLAQGKMALAIASVEPQWDASHALKLQLMDMAVAGDVAKAVAMLNKDETPLWRSIKKTVLECVAAQQKASHANLVAIESGERTVFRMFLGMAIASVILLALFIISLIRGVGHGAGAIVDYARAIGKGDFTKTPEAGLPREFAFMADSLLDMVRYLENSLGYYQGIVRGMATPFVVVDTNENLCLTNKDLMDLLEQDGEPEAYYGQNVAQFFYGETGRKTVLGAAMADGQPVRREVVLTSRKGSSRNVLIDATPLYNAINGRLMGAMCVYSDFTELRRGEALMLEQTGRMRDTAARDERRLTAWR